MPFIIRFFLHHQFYSCRLPELPKLLSLLSINYQNIISNISNVYPGPHILSREADFLKNDSCPRPCDADGWGIIWCTERSSVSLCKFGLIT